MKKKRQYSVGDRATWRTYAASALAKPDVNESESTRDFKLQAAASYADAMLELEKARFGEES